MAAVGGWGTVDSGALDQSVYRREVLGGRASTAAWRGGAIRDAHGQLLDDSSVHEIQVIGLVDRLPQEELVPFWRELYRVCRPAGVVVVSGAYWSSVEVASDPTRRRGLSERMFAYLSAPDRPRIATETMDEEPAAALLGGIDFEVTQIVRVTNPDWDARSEEAKAWALTYNLNVVRQMVVTLAARKPPRPAEATAP